MALRDESNVVGRVSCSMDGLKDTRAFSPLLAETRYQVILSFYAVSLYRNATSGQRRCTTLKRLACIPIRSLIYVCAVVIGGCSVALWMRMKCPWNRNKQPEPNHITATTVTGVSLLHLVIIFTQSTSLMSSNRLNDCWDTPLPHLFPKGCNKPLNPVYLDWATISYFIDQCLTWQHVYTSLRLKATCIAVR